MSDLGRDKFEEFLRDSLENYTSSDAPNWSEMEGRLDDMDAGSSGNSGILKSVVARWIAAAMVIGGLGLLVSNLFNDQVDNTAQNTSTQDSFIDKIRALTIEEDTKKVELAGDEVVDKTYEEGLTSEVLSTSDTKEKNSAPLYNNDSELTEGDVVFTKPVEPTLYYKPSGPTYDMLRAEFKDKETPDPVAAFGSDKKEGCVPLKLSFELESQDVAMKYFWDFGDGSFSTDANPNHTYMETGTYNVELTVTSLINQKSTTQISSDPVIVYGRPEVSFDWADDVNETGNEVSFIDLSSNVIDWYWDFGDRSKSNEENPVHIYADEGSYIVKLVGMDPNGCTDTLTAIILISGQKLADKIFAENAFTPDGDGINDVFKPKIIGAQNLVFEMSIYDRNSNLIFETNDINQGWDGRLKGSGRIAPLGTYIYYISLKDSKGNPQRRLGVVTIVQ